jgi:hypothetical protein
MKISGLVEQLGNTVATTTIRHLEGCARSAAPGPPTRAAFAFCAWWGGGPERPCGSSGYSIDKNDIAVLFEASIRIARKDAQDASGTAIRGRP